MRTFFLSEKIALYYCIGLGVLTLEMMLSSLLGVKFSMLSLFACLAVPVAIALSSLRGARSATKQSKYDSVPLSLLEKFFVLAISFEVMYAFFRTLIMPMESYDAIAIYALKSKIFYLAGGIPNDFFSAFKGFVPHIEYPLLIPLAETAFYVFWGSLNDLMVKIIFPLYYLSLIIVFYFVLKRFLSRRQSLLFTFMLATIPQVTDFATNGYTDLPFAFYCSSAIFYLYLWTRERKDAFLALSFILSALAVWTKTEGLMFTLINTVVVLACMAREKSFDTKGLIYATFSILMIVVDVFIWRSLGLGINSDFASPNTGFAARLVSGFERMPAILYEYQIQFFGPKKWNIVWILFLAGAAVGIKKWFSRELMPLTVALLSVFLGYTAVYMLSSAPQGIGWHLSTTSSRLFIHFVPVAALWLALLFKEFKLEV